MAKQLEHAVVNIMVSWQWVVWNKTKQVMMIMSSAKDTLGNDTHNGRTISGAVTDSRQMYQMYQEIQWHLESG